jgi:hypothetical protein
MATDYGGMSANASLNNCVLAEYQAGFMSCHQMQGFYPERAPWVRRIAHGVA